MSLALGRNILHQHQNHLTWVNYLVLGNFQDTSYKIWHSTTQHGISASTTSTL